MVHIDVTLLYFDDCPNWLVANEHLETLRTQHAKIGHPDGMWR